jgi:hypothetical protein
MCFAINKYLLADTAATAAWAPAEPSWGEDGAEAAYHKYSGPSDWMVDICNTGITYVHWLQDTHYSGNLPGWYEQVLKGWKMLKLLIQSKKYEGESWEDAAGTSQADRDFDQFKQEQITEMIEKTLLQDTRAGNISKMGVNDICADSIYILKDLWERQPKKCEFIKELKRNWWLRRPRQDARRISTAEFLDENAKMLAGGQKIMKNYDEMMEEYDEDMFAGKMNEGDYLNKTNDLMKERAYFKEQFLDGMEDDYKKAAKRHGERASKGEYINVQPPSRQSRFGSR